MVVNRYTQITPSQFKPLSLQEMALVPAAKRKEHDDYIMANEEYGALLDQVNSYEGHSDEVAKIRGELYGQMDSFAEQLNREGVSPALKSRAIGLNRTVRDEMGPQGRLGQIMAEREKIEALRKENLETAKKMGQDVNTANRKFNEALKNYTSGASDGWFENGKLRGFGFNDFAPKYVNDKDRMMDYLKQAKVSETVRKNASKYLVPDGNGFYSINESGRKELSSDNIAQLQAGYNMYLTELFDPTSELHKSQVYRGADMSAEAIQRDADTMIGRKVVNAEGKEVWVDGLFANRKNHLETSSGQGAIHAYPEGHANNPSTNNAPLSLPTTNNVGIISETMRTTIDQTGKDIKPGFFKTYGNIMGSLWKGLTTPVNTGVSGPTSIGLTIAGIAGNTFQELKKRQTTDMFENIQESFNDPNMQQVMNITGFSEDQLMTAEGLYDFAKTVESLKNNEYVVNERYTDVEQNPTAINARNRVYSTALAQGSVAAQDADGKPVDLSLSEIATIDVKSITDPTTVSLGPNNVGKAYAEYKHSSGDIKHVYIPSNDEIRAMSPLDSTIADIVGYARLAYNNAQTSTAPHEVTQLGENRYLQVMLVPTVGDRVLSKAEQEAEYGHAGAVKESFLFFEADKQGNAIENSSKMVESSEIADYLTNKFSRYNR